MRRRLPQSPSPESVPVVTINLGMEEKPTALAPTRRVLLLEDRSDYRNVLREYLITCAYQVTSVPSGIEGLREVMKARFDVIICDMMMPKMGGEMFYWAVTRVRPAARESFIFFTGHKNNPAIEFFFKRVKARVLFKPFKLASLDAAIQEIFLTVG
jgi:CheY-like chemotaxis protein